MATVTVTADWAYYQNTAQSGWWAIQNPWNSGSLVNGRDYTQQITADTAAFPNGTVLSWVWPNFANSTNVWGYPEVVYGSQAGIWQSPDGQGPTPVQLDHLATLIGTYNISLSGSADKYDVLWETHLTSAPNSGQIIEFGILSHSPSYVTTWFHNLPQQYTYSAAGLSATIGVTSNGQSPYILVLPDQGDMLSASVDIKSIFDFLILKGVLSGHEYIEGFEMGAEPQQGSGSITVNSIGYNWNGMIVGTPGNPPPPPPPPPVVTPDKLSLILSEDAWKGNAKFIAKVDGKDIIGSTEVTAFHGNGKTQEFDFTGAWSPNVSHDFEIDFINDNQAGPHSRNLYVGDVRLDGISYLANEHAMMANGAFHVMVGGV